MKYKNGLKIILDSVFILLLVLMYKKSIISMKFHEVGGLIVIGLLLIHLILNYKWIIGVSKKLFSKKIPLKTRLNYVISIILLICMILIGISGIFISKTIFKDISSSLMNWKVVHQSIAAFTLILTGVHIGLNWNLVIGLFKRIIKFPKRLSKPISLILLIIVFSFGCYSMITSSFGRWISMPFTVVTNNDKIAPHPDKGNKQAEVNSKNYNEKRKEKQGENEYKDRTNKSEGNAVNLLAIGEEVATFISIIGAFAIITFQIQKYIQKIKKNKVEKE